MRFVGKKLIELLKAFLPRDKLFPWNERELDIFTLLTAKENHQRVALRTTLSAPSSQRYAVRGWDREVGHGG